MIRTGDGDKEGASGGGRKKRKEALRGRCGSRMGMRESEVRRRKDGLRELISEEWVKHLSS